MKLSIDPMVKSNERIIFLKDLPSAVKLKNFIDELDERYDVDSSDPNNTFGSVNLENPIIAHGPNNTAYFAKAYGDMMSVPKHQKIPSGIYSIRELYGYKSNHLVDVAEDDFEKLIKLRQEFRKEVFANSPRYYDSKDIEKYLPEGSSGIECAGPNLKRFAYGKLLEDQGFVNHKSAFEVKIRVDNLGILEVRYGCVGSNPTPDFATSFYTNDGERGGQCQYIIPETHPAYTFWKKWDPFHLSVMTLSEFKEMIVDLNTLIAIVSKKCYKVSDDEWSEVFLLPELFAFAEDQRQNIEDDSIELPVVLATMEDVVTVLAARDFSLVEFEEKVII